MAVPVKFKPMLAASATNEEIEQFTFPLFASPKLDGIRAIVLDGVVYSRSMKPIRNKKVQELFGNPDFNGLDGELILGEPNHPDCFNRSTALMGEELRADVQDLEIGFYVFDVIPSRSNDISKVRYECLQESVRELHEQGYLNVHLVQQTLVRSQKELQDFENECLAFGYEGVMVKCLDGIYKQGRSTLKQRLLTKVKRFQDSEAEIIGYEERQKNIGEREISETGYSKTSSKKGDMIGAGMLGAVQVRDLETGLEFSLGSGFDDKTRIELWKNPDEMLGKIVKYKHFSIGVKELPRFPTFVGFRDLDDL